MLKISTYTVKFISNSCYLYMQLLHNIKVLNLCFKTIRCCLRFVFVLFFWWGVVKYVKSKLFTELDEQRLADVIGFTEMQDEKSKMT